MTRAKLQDLLKEYGQVAVYTYLAIWLAVLAGFVIAIALGFHQNGAAEGAGVLLSAWIATKLTQPLRIAATLGLTPLVAAVLRKWKRPPSASGAD